MGNNQSGTDFASVPHTVEADDISQLTVGGETCVYRSASHPEKMISNMIEGELNVAYDIFRRGYELTLDGSGDFLGIRRRANCTDLLGTSETDGELLPEYTYLTYREVDTLARQLGHVLLKMRLVEENIYPDEAYQRAQKLRIMCIASRNRAEWFITDLACQLFGFTSCPLYETFGENSIAFILAQSRSSIVAGSPTNLEGILDVLEFVQNRSGTHRHTNGDYSNAEDCAAVTLNGTHNNNATGGGGGGFRLNDDISQENLMRPQAKRSRTDNIKYFISFDNYVPLELQERAAKFNIQIFNWKQMIDKARQLAHDEPETIRMDPIRPHQHDVCSICYTSGTTGVPKGVLITHKAFAANISAALRGPLQGQGLDITPSDIYMSYLPLAHVLERVLCCICMAIGAKIAIYSGDTKALLEDIRIAEPSIFASVPRLFMRINDRIQTGLDQNSPIVRYLFEKGMSAKIERLRTQGEVQHSFWDALIFKRIRQLLGPNLRYMISGGAALEKEIQEKMACLFSCRLLEGYGLTETLGATFIRRGVDAIYGHIGMPLPCVEIKLIAVPEMGYYVTKRDQIEGEATEHGVCKSPSGSAAGGSPTNRNIDAQSPGKYSPTGELAIRGFTVTPGYFLNREATAEAFENYDPYDCGDGRVYRWFKTGDVAVRLSDKGGRVKIIDRKKNLFKMSQGEYIAPERIENIYMQIPIISQIFVYGDSSKVYLVAIVTLDEEEYQKWRIDHHSKKSPSRKDTDRLLGDEPDETENAIFKKYLLSEMDRVTRDGQLKGFEKVKNVYFTTEQFTSESGLLTPTFKLKRNVAKTRFWDQITTLYNESF